jgi:hypothetical protein
MKANCLTLILILVAFVLNAQSTPDSLYIVTFSTGSAWNAAKAANEQPYFKEHSANLARWRKEGIIKLGARYADKGMIVISAPSLAVARQLISNEDGVANNLFAADVQTFNVFYAGCLEKPAPKN